MLAHCVTILVFFVLDVDAVSEQRTIRSCEPPKYIDKLPTFAQEELRSTWKNYKKGESCEGELLITDDILAAVDIFAQSYATPTNNSPLAKGKCSCSLQGFLPFNNDPEVSTQGGVKFLKTLGPQLRRIFENVMNDPDIPSEGLRREKIHLLAVSLLNPDQLLAYNKYATDRRERARAHRTELAKLSNEARKAFRVIARAEPSHQYVVAKDLPAKVRRELKNFAAARVRVY
uniref:Uncharacterized protein n=1 Tax=Parascaris univalens TaxID=6257 RepID=A0A915AYL2_PARUN